MGIQINGNTDTISATDGSLSIVGQELTGVTDINASGIITASQINVGAAITISGGIVTATSFSGDGSNITGISTLNIVDYGVGLGGGGGESYWVSTAAGIHTLSNVGIGTTNPTRPLNVKVTGSVNILGVFDGRDADPGTVGNCVIAFSDPTSTAGQFSTRLGSVGDSLAFYTNGANERMRILSGGGLTFNGDTAAANALDDYEEGTWTPNIGGSATYDIQWGTYIKVGKQVTCWGGLRPTSTSGGNLRIIQGLPYTVQQPTTATQNGGGSIVWYDGSAASHVNTPALACVYGSTIADICIRSSASSSLQNNVDFWAANFRANFWMTYQTS